MEEAIDLTNQILQEAEALAQSHMKNADDHVLMDMALILVVARLTVGIERCMNGIEKSMDLIG